MVEDIKQRIHNALMYLQSMKLGEVHRLETDGIYEFSITANKWTIPTDHRLVRMISAIEQHGLRMVTKGIRDKTMWVRARPSTKIDGTIFRIGHEANKSHLMLKEHSNIFTVPSRAVSDNRILLMTHADDQVTIWQDYADQSDDTITKFVNKSIESF